MNQTLKDAMLFGVGLVSMSKEKIESTLNQLSKDWKTSEPEGRKMVDEFLKESENAKKKVEDSISQKVNEAIAKIPLATKASIEALEKRLEKIEKSLAAQKKKSE